MKQSVNLHDFRQAFQDTGWGDNFSYEGLGALFDWLEECEDDTGEEIELDVIALCCDFSEYDLDDLKREYTPYNDETTDFETFEEWLDWLNERTLAIAADQNSVIVQTF